MQVHEHELLLQAVDGDAGDEQTALEIGDAHRPRERARQAVTRGSRDVVAAVGRNAGVHAADGFRDGIGHIITGIVQGKAALIVLEIEFILPPLVIAVAALRIRVDLLQHHEVGVRTADEVLDAEHILPHGLCIGRSDALAAVHEEVLPGVQPAVAGIERQHADGLAARELALAQDVAALCVLGIGRAVFRDREIADAARRDDGDGQHKEQEIFDDLPDDPAAALRLLRDLRLVLGSRLVLRAQLRQARRALERIDGIRQHARAVKLLVRRQLRDIMLLQCARLLALRRRDRSGRADRKNGCSAVRSQT